MARATKPLVREPWGNAVSGSPDIVEAVYVDTGFPAPAGVPVKPPRGNVNFEFNRYDRFKRYMEQRGIVDWDTSETDYDVGDIVRAPADGRFYVLVGTATPGTAPTADLTNWHMWLRSPRGKATVYAEEVIAWMNANGHRGFGLDHFGLPRGRFAWFEETWTDYAPQKESPALPPGSNAAWFGPWAYGLFGSAAQVYSNGAASALNIAPWGAICGAFVNGGTTIASASVVEMVKSMATMSGSVMAIEAAMSINGSGSIQPDSTFAFGIGDGTLIGGASTVAMDSGFGAIPKGVYIWADPSDHWIVVSRGTGIGNAASTVTAVAVAKDTTILWQAYIVGGTADDSSTARVLHYINGTLVADHAVVMLNEKTVPFVRTSSTGSGGGETCGLNVGRVRIIPRLELGDVF